MESSSSAPPTPIRAIAEPRQRWRLTYCRRADAPALPQREQLDAWEASLRRSGLPFAGLDLPRPRPRLVFGAPLAVGMAAEHELLDLFMVQRFGVAEVRARLAGSLPAGHELVELYDVWIGEPPLPGQVVAADYRVDIISADGGAPDREVVAGACARLLAAPALPRARRKGDRSVTYDLRPLVMDVETRPEADASASEGPRTAEAPGISGSAAARDAPEASLTLRIRTRVDPQRGVGRPEEVVAAIAELAGTTLVAGAIVREQLILGGAR